MLTHRFNTEGAKIRLLSDYNKYGNLVIGFDFDNTIYDYNHSGFCEEGYDEIINLLKRAQEVLNYTMCLYTSETDSEKLKWKIDYIKNLGIKVKYINCSPLSLKAIKPHFSILLDDRAGLESAYDTLKFVVDEVELIKNKENA